MRPNLEKLGKVAQLSTHTNYFILTAISRSTFVHQLPLDSQFPPVILILGSLTGQPEILYSRMLLQPVSHPLTAIQRGFKQKFLWA